MDWGIDAKGARTGGDRAVQGIDFGVLAKSDRVCNDHLAASNPCAMREARLGRSVTQAEIRTFEMHNGWLRPDEGLATAARCEHCAGITRGVQVTESQFRAEGGVSGEFATGEITTSKGITETAVKAGAEGALTRGLGATVLEVAFNPALMLGWEILKGISGDYQQGWDDIRRPARHIGFAQGWAARLAGLDITWIKSNLAPQFVDRSDVATEALGATGMAEHAYIVGLGEGFRYGAGYSDAMKAKKLGQAFEKIKARHEDVYFDTDKALTPNSLILVAAMLQQEADRGISRWDDLREQRKKQVEEEADFKRRSENWTGHMQ